MRGQREFFHGLYIDGTDYDWQAYPIVHLDFAQANMGTLHQLEQWLCRELGRIGLDYGLQLQDDDAVLLFDTLIKQLYRKTGQGVVILIDEYDKPIFEHLQNATDAKDFRDFLASFYQIIKGAEPMLRFTFLTGVTKLAKLSVFSKLNNLTDITMNPEFACMFGYTQQELETYFADWLQSVIADKACSAQGQALDLPALLKEIKLWYDGFRFVAAAPTVYNPVSIGQFFLNQHTFANYWFETGTPSFIIQLLRRNKLTTTDIEGTLLSDSYLRSFDVTELAGTSVPDERIIDLLFQSGYLTIGRLVRSFPERVYQMHFPNHEVAYSFEQNITNWQKKIL